jgi:GNAT superfamily N-acetyltransferase
MPQATIPFTRPATPGDVPLILDLIRALADYEKLSHQVIATAADLHHHLFIEPAAHALIAELDSQPVGFALYFYNFSSFLARPGLYLEDIFVIPEARGNGIGRLLLQHLAAIAAERGCGRFEWSVLDWNKPAIDFYCSHGAEILPDWRTVRMEGESILALATRP